MDSSIYNIHTNQTSLQDLMKEISEAIKLDDESQDKEAYIKYTTSIYKIASNLLHNTHVSHQNLVVTPNVTRQVKLLQQCVDRVNSLVDKMGHDQHQQSNFPSSQTNPSNQQMSMRGFQEQPKNSDLSQDMLPGHHSLPIHIDVPALSNENNPHVYSKARTMSPLEKAHAQNRSLIIAYKARMKRLNQSNFSAYNYSLTLQRKMAENLAIAKAQEEELAKKMKARQERLEEEASRRFSHPNALSQEEKEHQKIYKNILDYENDVERLTKWRPKLTKNREDPVLICQIVQEILRCADHPLTDMLRKLQFKVHEQLYPLVANKHTIIDQIKVELPDHLWPMLEDVSDIIPAVIFRSLSSVPAPEVRRRKRVRSKTKSASNDSDNHISETSKTSFSDEDDKNKAGKDENQLRDDIKDNNVMSGEESEYEKNINAGECGGGGDALEIVNKDLTEETLNKDIVVEESCGNENVVKKEEKEEDYVDGVGGGCISNMVNAGTDGKALIAGCIKTDESEADVVTIKPDDHNIVNPMLGGDCCTKSDDDKPAPTDHPDDGSSTSASLQDDSSNSSGEESDTRHHVESFASTVSHTHIQLREACDKGAQLEAELTLQRQQARLLMQQISRDYDSIDAENFDDLFDDDEDEVEGANVSGEDGANSDNLPTMQSRSESDTASVVSNESGDIEANHNEFHRSQSSQSRQRLSSQAPNQSMDDIGFSSLPPNINATPSPVVSNSCPERHAMSKLTLEAYGRHLMGICNEIHLDLDKLLQVMIVAYEALDTPVGKDQTAVALEEPFFKPIWKTLLRLFRVVNHKKETVMACVMTSYKGALPETLKVRDKFCLANGPDRPYKEAIDELLRLPQYYTILCKLDCMVKVCRLICECVDKYYTSKEIPEGKAKATPVLGADDLLPVLTYVIVSTECPQLVSECQAMSEFIAEGYMMGEEGYCLTSFRTAMEYLLSLFVPLNEQGRSE